MKNPLSNYESILIFSSNYAPKKLKYVAYYYAKNLKKWGATNIHIKYRGKRDLAYPIENSNIANYIEISFNLFPYNIELYKKVIRLDSKIIRAFIIKKKPQKVSS